jgi:hypothetical protein
MRAGSAVEGLDGRPALTEAELDATDRIVAMAGVHPYIRLLEQGADVIIGGRSSDCALFAAAAIHRGFPEALSYYLGKVLECASFCAEPYGGKETVLGEITAEAVKVTAMHPAQRCTIASVAGHAMYERADPYYEHVAGGTLDMSTCRYEQHDERTTRVTGPRFVKAPELRVKLEGSGKVGERHVGLVGIRDPYTIAHVDKVIAWARQQVEERFGPDGYELHCTVYGRNGVMGPLEPTPQPAHGLCVVVQGVAPTRAMAEELAMIGSRQMFYARLPEVKGTAGSVAFLLDEVLPAGAGYRWTLNHTVAVDHPLELFPTHIATLGARGATGMPARKLSELAKTIRSKNAGVDKITFDIIFQEAASYELVKRSRVLTRESVARLYRIPERRISDLVEFDPAFAIKLSIYRQRPSGSPGDADIFGAQQYAPLLDLAVPVPDAR